MKFPSINGEFYKKGNRQSISYTKADLPDLGADKVTSFTIDKPLRDRLVQWVKTTAEELELSSASLCNWNDGTME